MAFVPEGLATIVPSLRDETIRPSKRLALS